MMTGFILLIVVFSSLNLGKSFILVPADLPLLAQIFYTNIPPIRKGIDSKVGLGFRIGNNVDLQVMFELGPQENRIDNNLRRSVENEEKRALNKTP